MNAEFKQHLLRAQAIAHYREILVLLDKFPAVRQSHFLIGEPFEKKNPADDLESSLTPDPRYNII